MTGMASNASLSVDAASLVSVVPWVPLHHSIGQLSSNFTKSGLTMDPVYRSSENPFQKREENTIDWAHVKTREMFND
jgi:hypothetical protein